MPLFDARLGLNQYSGLKRLSAPSSSSIVYVDLDPDEVLTGPSDSFDLDLDGDTVDDFRFTLITGPLNQGAIDGDFASVGNCVVGVGGQASNLASGVDINSTNVNFTELGTVGFFTTLLSLTGGNFVGETGYIGVQFKISGNTHYGWAEITVPSNVSTMTITRYAYNATADAGIKAGQTS